jgi:hypothetical protein
MAPLVEMLPTNFFPSVPPSIGPELAPESGIEPEPELEEPELVEAPATELDAPPEVELPLVAEPELEPELEEGASPPEPELAEVPRPPSSAGYCWLPSGGLPDDPQAKRATVATAGSRRRKRVLRFINSAVAVGARTRQRIRARHSRHECFSQGRHPPSGTDRVARACAQRPYPAATMLAWTASSVAVEA